MCTSHKACGHSHMIAVLASATWNSSAKSPDSDILWSAVFFLLCIQTLLLLQKQSELIKENKDFEYFQLLFLSMYQLVYL